MSTPLLEPCDRQAAYGHVLCTTCLRNAPGQLALRRLLGRSWAARLQREHESAQEDVGVPYNRSTRSALSEPTEGTIWASEMLTGQRMESVASKRGTIRDRPRPFQPSFAKD